MAKTTVHKEAKQEAGNAHRDDAISTRGRTFVGTVTSDKMSKTVIVAWTRKFYVKKFERYERRTSKLSAHNPDSINAKKGDVVRIMETRPLSKTKNFIVVEILGRETKREHVKSESIEDEAAREEASRKHADKPEGKKADKAEDSDN